MPQFVIIARDYQDEDALSRRLACRDEHFRRIARLRDLGHFLVGGAILDDAERMIGSVLIGSFDSRQELDERWLSQEPYISERVWEHIEVLPYRVALFGHPMLAAIEGSLPAIPQLD